MRTLPYPHSGLAEATGYRSILSVPLIRDGHAVGAITVAASQPGAFTEQQIELLQTFADQAVIAIENTRLFEAVQASTRELTEALEQQTATSEVLQVISSSPGELEPVFQAMLANATRLCEAKFGTLFRYDGNLLHRAAGSRHPRSLGRVPKATRAVPAGFKATSPRSRPADKASGPQRRQRGRTAPRCGDHDRAAHGPSSAVPMLKDNELVGAIVIYRQEVRPVHRQADRAGHELRCPGRHRHREHPPAQRAARIPPTADRDCRRAQGHRPPAQALDVQRGPRYACRVRSAPVRYF